VERPTTILYGKLYPGFWLNARPEHTPLPDDTSIHICLRASDEAAVRAFDVATRSGWTDAGSPGPRQAAMTVYYAAFVQDPDGNKLEAANFPRKA
jgi:catechol 2,3-dioxygenase-like lactoylglutathione lyase family enzyme